MKQHLLNSLILLFALIAGGNVWGQDRTTIYSETFGSPSSNTDVSAFKGFSSSLITPTSTGWKVGKTDACNLEGSSGNGNAYCGSTSDIVFNFGDKLSSYSDVKLSFNYRKGAGNNKANTIKLYFSADGGKTYGSDLIPSNTGASSTWYSVTNITIPAASLANFCMKFSSKTNTNRIDDIIITGIAAAPTTCATPTISGDAKFLESTEVSISCGTDGAAIQYSTDNGTNWNDYSAPFTITETTTVKAKATKPELDPSDEASMTFTKVTPMTVAEAKDYIDAGVDLENQYVRGKISQIDSYSSNTITYWISDDGTTTNQMEVFRGKGLNNANFTAITNLEVGDVVVVYGKLTKYNSTICEFDTGNYLISRTEKPASDLTKIADVTLDFKNGETMASLTDYFTTSSTGAITYTVADGTVIENADEVISALKVGTTTVTVSQAANLNYKAGEITINVTVQDTRVDATTIPAINISTLKADAPKGTISVVNPVKADEGVTFSFTSSNEDVLLIDGTSYIVGNVGIVTVTVTATPSNSNLYKPVVKNFNVIVERADKIDNAINLDATSGSTVYGTKKSVGYELVDADYDGVVSYTINNAAIADVEVGASAITFTPKAVGTAVITIVAPATATYNEAEPKTYTLTVTAPAGGTVAPAAVSPVTLDFSSNTGWSFPTSKTVTTNTYTNGGHSVVLTGTTGYGYYFNGQYDCLLIGKNGATIGLPSFTDIISSIVVTGHTNASGSVKMNIYDGETAVSTETTGIKSTQTFNIAEANQGANKSYALKITSGDNAQIKSIQFNFKTVTITATLNASGYATYCSEYPLDFTDAETDGYSAWQITNVSSEGVITFAKVTGTVKGGTGLLLKGNTNATVTLTSSNSDKTLDDNMLVGTLAPSYFAAGDIYGLSADTFKKNSAGTMKANKAYLPASEIPSSSIKSFTLVFEDQETGITITETMSADEVREIFDLQGRRLARPIKGINIINGKKVLVK